MTFIMPHCNVIEILENLWRRSGNKFNHRQHPAQIRRPLQKARRQSTPFAGMSGAK
jgi:hypothetical protein